MRAIIGSRLLSSQNARVRASVENGTAVKPFEIWDSRLKGFLVRVQPSGARSYFAQVGRGRRVLIGKVGQFAPDEARERCEKIIGNVANGRDPFSGLRDSSTPTFNKFVEDWYAPWVRANRPRGAEYTLQRLKRCFSKWNGHALDELTPTLIEHWKLKRFEAKRKPATVLRDISMLSGVLSRAVKLGHLASNPVSRVDKPKIDRMPKVRYLDSTEEIRLRTALRDRDAEMEKARESANRWRSARKRETLPALPHFGDHLTPAVIVSMNTGLRRGELLALCWTDIDFTLRQITVDGASAKNGNTRYLPMNDDATDTLTLWKAQSSDKTRVFPIDTGFKSAWKTLLIRADISKFRWHDIRHHFASRLVQAGVPLNTVRELLGHGSLAMTLRYAHLAPDQRREAVEQLNRNSDDTATKRLENRSNAKVAANVEGPISLDQLTLRSI